MKPGEVCDVEPAGFGAVVRTTDGTWWLRVNHESVKADGVCREDRWKPAGLDTRHTWEQVLEQGEALLVCAGIEIPPQHPRRKKPDPKTWVKDTEFTVSPTGTWSSFGTRVARVSAGLAATSAAILGTNSGTGTVSRY